jgi:hypothetical protein
MTASAEASAAAPPLNKRVPDFFIVGHAKSGTSALYKMLKLHPQIFMPSLKEPWFFVPELRSATPGRHPSTLEEYLALFDEARPDQRIGEATPSYLLSRTAAARIAEVQPQARIIAIFREPASFLRSLHLQFVQTDVETETDLRTALALEDARREGKSLPRHSTRPQTLLYSEHVHYAEQLRRYHAVFPREQVLALIYEEFLQDNAAMVREILRFLDVDDTHPIELIRWNSTVRVRAPRMHQLVRSLYLGRDPTSRAVKSAVKRVTSKKLRRGALRATRSSLFYANPAPPDEELTLELRRRFRGEVEALGDYLDRDLLTLWGYDSVS